MVKHFFKLVFLKIKIIKFINFLGEYMYLNLSKGSEVALDYANIAVWSSKNEFLTEDFLLLGIFSINKAFSMNIDKTTFNIIKYEYDEINSILNHFNLTFENIHNELKSIIGKGNSKRKNVKDIEKTKSCNEILYEAKDLSSKEQSNIRCIHLLRALLITPTPNSDLLFKNLNVNINEFKEKCGVNFNSVIKPSKGPINVKNEIKGKSTLSFSQDMILGQYGENLNETVLKEGFSPIIGREKELEQLEITLNKRKKSNPLIIGEPGVGKTALVQALALKIVKGEVSDKLKDKVIIEISVGSLEAGTKYRGVFSERINQLLNELKQNPNVILFIDEIHTILGAGSAGQSSLDAANMLKPALANGDISLIGATTHKEYKKNFEKDSAFERRFQPIMVEEPSPEETIKILDGLKEYYENSYKIEISDEAINAAVNLSVRYITDRNLPDKAIDVIDETCARIYTTNPSKGTINEEDVRNVVSVLTGIPVDSESSQLEKIRNIEKYLKDYIVGQDEAITIVSKRIKMAHSGIQDPNKPLAVFLFLGNTGVGKTYMSKLLAKYLFGDENSLKVFDMSEYNESNSTTKFIGASPGYIGYGEGGTLTNAIRKKPYSIILFDEIEKGDDTVFDLFLQLFDEGRLTDSTGITVNARNCIFVMTSNKNLDSLEHQFRREFLNRIDDIIEFNDLGQESSEKLVELYINQFEKDFLKQNNNSLILDDSVLKFLASTEFDKNLGARNLNRSLDNLIKLPISDLIINKKLKKGDNLKLTILDNKLLIEIE